jgi:hypothetical protein
LEPCGHCGHYITFVCIKWWRIPSIDETIIPFNEVLSNRNNNLEMVYNQEKGVQVIYLGKLEKLLAKSML